MFSVIASNINLENNTKKHLVIDYLSQTVIVCSMIVSCPDTAKTQPLFPCLVSCRGPDESLLGCNQNGSMSTWEQWRKLDNLKSMQLMLVTINKEDSIKLSAAFSEQFL